MTFYNRLEFTLRMQRNDQIRIVLQMQGLEQLS